MKIKSFLKKQIEFFAMTFQGRATRATMWRGFGGSTANTSDRLNGLFDFNGGNMSFRDFFSFNGKLSSKKFWCYLLILCGVSWFVHFIWMQYLYSINKDSIDSYFVFLLERFVSSLKWYGLVIPKFVDSCFDFYLWWSLSFSVNLSSLPILLYSIACFVFFANLLRRRLMDIENGGKLLVSFVSFFLIRVILFDILPELNNDIYKWEYWEVLSIFLTIVLNGLIIAIGFKKTNTNNENQEMLKKKIICKQYIKLTLL